MLNGTALSFPDDGCTDKENRENGQTFQDRQDRLKPDALKIRIKESASDGNDGQLRLNAARVEVISRFLLHDGLDVTSADASLRHRRRVYV